MRTIYKNLPIYPAEKKEEHQLSLFNESPIASFILDRHWIIKHVNNAGIDLLKSSRSKLINTSFRKAR